MKITWFGLTISSSWGNGHATPYRALLEALHRLGHRIVFCEKNTDYYSKRRDFTAADYCSLVLYSRWDEVRASAMEDAASSDAVIVGSYCPEGARIADEVLALARPLRVFYDLDTPITLHNLETGPVPYLRADQMPSWDLYLSFTGGGILDELENRWRVRRARPLFGCVDPDVHARVAPRPEFSCLLSYMGTYAADRHAKVEQLFLEPARRRPDDRFLLAGSLYPAHSAWPPNLQLMEHVAPGDHPALYSSSRLTLNVTRVGMARFGYCPSGRFFEAAACGTPLVTDWWDGLHTFFADDELFVAHNSDHVLDALSASDEELARVAARARQRTLDEHTGNTRATQLLEYLQEARRPNSRAEAVA
ncbi:MAG: CgeB family protein [Terriglobales bacterium]